ncbi:tetratricopeptide repeat protein [Paraglaciecola aestuariivivens]
MSCQSKVVVTLPPAELMFYDQGYPQAQDVQIESTQQIFYLDQEAQDFVNKIIASERNRIDQMELLIQSIFDRSELNLLYQGDANTTANATFHNKAANCLSMSIMTYALARHAGFNVNFQEVMIPEYWTRRSGFSLLNGHINLKMLAPKEPNIMVLNTRAYQVDFDPQTARQSLPKRLVNKSVVVAMFYNNKGADAVLNHQYDRAYAYFRAALKTHPRFHSAWINLGILYRLSGHYEQAEQAYLYALQLNSNSLTAWENLAYLYNFMQREDEANNILARVEKKRESNPYYHVNLGEQQLEQKHWDQALAHFRKALAIDRSKHEVYFGLAKVYFEIGEFERSEKYLKQAKYKAGNRLDEERYQNKIEFLNSL